MLKYYLYISQAKVDMLFPQIPASFLSGAEAEWKLNLGVTSVGLKSRSPEKPTELTGRVSSVAAYIRQHELVGTTQSPAAWFQGTEKFRWGVLRDYVADIVLFAGTSAGKTIALLGSKESIVGASQNAGTDHGIEYYTLRFLNGVVRGSEQIEPRERSCAWSPRLSTARSALPEHEQELEYLARFIHAEDDLIIGTPLYVALH
jgi:hypothetical protein